MAHGTKIAIESKVKTMNYRMILYMKTVYVQYDFFVLGMGRMVLFQNIILAFVFNNLLINKFKDKNKIFEGFT